MLSISFQTSAIAIAQIFAMGSIGYLLTRRNIINAEGLKLLTFLSINIVFPLFIFLQIIRNFDPAKIHMWWGYPLINIGLTILGLSVTALICWLSRRKPTNELRAVTCMHNAGYVPLLMAMALPLGDIAGQVYTAVIMSIIGFDICLWSLGVWLMTREEQPHMDLRKMITPPLMAMFGAIIIVLLGWQGFLTESLTKPIKIMGDSAMGITMFIIGGNLAVTQFKGMRVSSVAGVVLVKLMLIPSITLTALLFLHLDPIMNFVLMLQSCMPTSITLSILGRYYGNKDQDFINQCVFITHILCVITLPIFLGLYGKLIN